MRVKQETLSTAVTTLERALAPDGGSGSRAWAMRLEQALAAITQGVRLQEELLDSPGGVTEVSGGQAPSSGTDRRVNGLHDDLDALLAEANDLRAQLRRSVDCAAAGGTGLAESGGLRRRAGALLAALNRYEQEEARLILETATTDIGAGD